MPMTFPDRQHPDVDLVKHPDGWTAEIDHGIAPLISCLWELGFDTQASCQGSDDIRAYVLFNGFLSAGQFAVAAGCLGGIRLMRHGGGAMWRHVEQIVVPDWPIVDVEGYPNDRSAIRIPTARLDWVISLAESLVDARRAEITGY